MFQKTITLHNQAGYTGHIHCLLKAVFSQTLTLKGFQLSLQIISLKFSLKEIKTTIQERKKALKVEYILYDFIDIKFQKADQCLGPGVKEERIAKGHERTFEGEGNIHYLHCWVVSQVYTHVKTQ